MHYIDAKQLRKTKMLKLLLFICSFFISSAYAQTATELQQIEQYLNQMKSLNASFVQTASNGSTAEGKIFIQKPNKIRMEYADPASILIVGNGEYVVFNDKELDQITNIDYEDIPASMILADNIKIDNQNLKIRDFYKDAGSTSITLEHTKSADIGPITLVFSNSPFELKQWKIIDPQNIEVTISLFNASKDASLDEDLFKFKNPRKNKRRRR